MASLRLLLSRSSLSSSSVALLSRGKNSTWDEESGNIAQLLLLRSQSSYLSVLIILSFLSMENLWMPHLLPLASWKTFPTLDPRTGEVIAHAKGDAEDVNRAVSALARLLMKDHGQE